MDSRTDMAGATRGRTARVGLYIHLAVYLAVNALLAAVNLATTPDRLWFRWPLLGWGVGILAHAAVAFALPLLRANPSRR